jgi:hypothetical protein
LVFGAVLQIGSCGTAFVQRYAPRRSFAFFGPYCRLAVIPGFSLGWENDCPDCFLSGFLGVKNLLKIKNQQKKHHGPEKATFFNPSVKINHAN